MFRSQSFQLDRNDGHSAIPWRRIRLAKILAPAVLAASFALSPASALAASATATGTITAGTLSLATAATPAFSATLNGTTDQTPTYTVPMTLTDATGGGLGWNTTINSTVFTSGAPVHTLSTTASSITGVTESTVSGTATPPTNTITYGGPLSIPTATTVKFFNAGVNTGLGVFLLTPTVQVAIPANTFAGTYTSTLTLASVSAP